MTKFVVTRTVTTYYHCEVLAADEELAIATAERMNQWDYHFTDEEFTIESMMNPTLNQTKTEDV